MRVLVTGSSGQLGSSVVHALAQRHEVVGLDVCESATTTHVGSVTDRERVLDLTRGADAIVHTASLHAAHISTHAPPEFVEININGTMNLLDAAVQHRIRRFVYTSTTSVYGHAMTSPEQAIWVTEDLVPQPRDIYDITKLAAEQLCAVAARTCGMTCPALRVSRFFPEPQRLIAIYRLYRGVDVRDATAAHVLALEDPSLSGFDVFNISARSPFSRDQLYQLKHHAPRLLRSRFHWIEPAFDRRDWDLPASIDRVYVTAKAERTLGYRPAYGLVQYLQELGETMLEPAAGNVEEPTLWS
jgi:nucleoside-diphosphate-sugar epimerase